MINGWIMARRRVSLFALLFLAAVAGPAQSAPATPLQHNPIRRTYVEGEPIRYTMQGLNRGRLQTRQYEAQVSGVVRKDSEGVFFEDLGWSGLSLNGSAFPLNQVSQEFRQPLSLAPDYRLSIPDLSNVQPALIGPITDLLTFYADVQLAARQPALQHAGDHAYVKHGTPNSWADGHYTLLGQDSIDFDILLQSIDTKAHCLKLRVRHVPPAQPQVPLQAEWMRTPVGRTANNWVEVEKTAEGKYAAEVGEESFEAVITIDETSGRILDATLENPVDVLERVCTDETLHACGEPVRYRIFRRITLTTVTGSR